MEDRWYAGGCAHPGHVRSLSPTGEVLSLKTFEFLSIDGGWSPKLGDTFVPSGQYREKQNRRGRRYDQSRLKTMFLDGAYVRQAQRRQPKDKLLLNLNYAEYFVALPPSRRKPAGGYGTISWTPLWSFSGQDRKPCERLIPDKNADDGNQPSLCAVTRKADVSAKVSQSSVHWSGHTASTATTSCPRFCFLVTPLRHHLDCSVFCGRSFQCRHRLKNGFSNRGMQCARLDTFSVDNTKIRR